MAEIISISGEDTTSAKNVALVEDGLMTVKEAVAFSRVGRSDLYLRMERGELPYVKLGKRRLIPKKALVELVAKNVVSRDS